MPSPVFASFKCKGKRPRVANMLVESHVRPVTVKAGELVKGDDNGLRDFPGMGLSRLE